jgi:hypothetical protein
MFEIIEREDVGSDWGTVIKVIGVGGAGGNAVDHMIREGVMGVEFVAANTDAQALKRSVAHKKVRLGKTGLGAGAKPEAGRNAAVEIASRSPKRSRARTWSSSPPAWAAAPAPAPRRRRRSGARTRHPDRRPW